MKERILVTGGAGFIGSHLIDELIKKYEVYSMDNSFPRYGNHILPKEVHQICGDIRNFDHVDFATSNMDYVVHLAALSHVGSCLQNPKLCFDINVGGTTNILNACKKNNVKRIIIAASDHIYGKNPSQLVDENHSMNALNESDPYGMSKAMQAKLAYLYFKQYNLPVVITASGNVFSERQSMPNAIPNFINACKNNTNIMIHGDGKQTRDFYHVSNLVNGYIKCIETPNIEGELFNFSGGKAISINEVVNMILDIYKSKIITNKNQTFKSHIKYIHSPELNAMNHMQLDISKAKKLLNWEPKIGLEEGLQMTIEATL